MFKQLSLEKCWPQDVLVGLSAQLQTLLVLTYTYILGSPREMGVCEQQRHSPACAFAQSEQRL